MSELRKRFDRPAFVVRVSVIIAVATLLLAERLRVHDHIGVALVVAIGYVVLPVVAYLHTRYKNSKFIVGIVEGVRRRVVGRGPGAPHLPQ